MSDRGRLVLLLLVSVLFIATGMVERQLGPLHPPHRPRCEEDAGCWDCTTMGNRVCGSENNGRGAHVRASQD